MQGRHWKGVTDGVGEFGLANYVVFGHFAERAPLVPSPIRFAYPPEVRVVPVPLYRVAPVAKGLQVVRVVGAIYG